jgi:hypothetical protein
VAIQECAAPSQSSPSPWQAERLNQRCCPGRAAAARRRHRRTAPSVIERPSRPPSRRGCSRPEEVTATAPTPRTRADTKARLGTVDDVRLAPRRQNQGSERAARYCWDLPVRSARRSVHSQLLDGCSRPLAAGAGSRYTPTTPLPAVKVGPSARALRRAPDGGSPDSHHRRGSAGACPHPTPRRPNYANRNGQLIPECLDRQRPTSDNARLRIEGVIRTFR